MQEIFFIICLFILLLSGCFLGIHISSKKIKKLEFIIKQQGNPVSNYFNNRLKSSEKDYFFENQKLKSKIDKIENDLVSTRLDCKNKLSEKYCQSEYIELNSKIKKQEKKIKEMYKIMPMYKDFYSFLNNQYKKKES